MLFSFQAQTSFFGCLGVQALDIQVDACGLGIGSYSTGVRRVYKE